MNIKVENEIYIYEINGKETRGIIDENKFTVSSHWNRNEMVVLQNADGDKITVSASELKRAVENATNTR